MGGAPSIPKPPALPPPPTEEDPAIERAREEFKTTQEKRETRRKTVLTESGPGGKLLGEEAEVLKTKLGGS